MKCKIIRGKYYLGQYKVTKALFKEFIDTSVPADSDVDGVQIYNKTILPTFHFQDEDRVAIGFCGQDLTFYKSQHLGKLHFLDEDETIDFSINTNDDWGVYHNDEPLFTSDTVWREQQGKELLQQALDGDISPADALDELTEFYDGDPLDLMDDF